MLEKQALTSQTTETSATSNAVSALHQGKVTFWAIATLTFLLVAVAGWFVLRCLRVCVI